MRTAVARMLLFLMVLLAGRWPLASAQSPATDSMRQVLAATPRDSTRVLALLQLAQTYRASRPDSLMLLTQQAWQLARQVGFDKGRGRAQAQIGAALREKGELPKAYANQLIARQLSRQHHDLEGEAYSLNALGNISLDLQQYQQAIAYYQQSKALYKRLKLNTWVVGSDTNIGSCYEKMNQLGAALRFQKSAEALIARNPQSHLAVALSLRNMGVVQARLGNLPLAFDYYRRALRETYLTNDLRNRSMTQYHIARLHRQLHQPDSALYYARQALRTAQRVKYRVTVLGAGNLLTQLFQTFQRPDSALYYQQLAIAAHDSLYGPDKFRQLQLLAFSEQQRQIQQRDEHARQTARYQRLALWAGLGVSLLLALVLGVANYRQRRTNRLLHERNAQIEAQRNALDQALTELRTTQDQLVAAEKWALVGELSTGIAHELQNPLVFMRNFADVSLKLLGQNGHAQPTGVKKEIMAGLRQNLEEISQHGQRASSIIAEMLAHTRPDSSQREPTDLNTLVAENLRLAYETSPARHLTPAVELETEFAPGQVQVEAYRPELGRALLNLFANALQAVRRRQATGEMGYQPRVSVATRRVGAQTEVRVRDNGTGISSAVMEQVFQPFFTTKLAGEGTGLALALAHDIITKAHLGTLTVDTREGEYTEFTVRIPAV